MQINSLKKLLKGFEPKTPPPERNKVVSIPTRTPVNRQALRVILSNPDWLAAPPEEKFERPTREAHDALAARLKIEFNEHAVTREKLGAANARIRELLLENRQLFRKIEHLTQESAQLRDTIRQLEDLRL